LFPPVHIGQRHVPDALVIATVLGGHNKLCYHFAMTLSLQRRAGIRAEAYHNSAAKLAAAHREIDDAQSAHTWCHSIVDVESLTR